MFRRFVSIMFTWDASRRMGSVSYTHLDVYKRQAMGSEYETVIMPLLKAHTIMMYRNLLYTGDVYKRQI